MRKISLIAGREYRKLVLTPGVILTILILIVSLVAGFSIPFIMERTEPIKYIGFVSPYDGEIIEEIEKELTTRHKKSVLHTWDLYLRVLGEAQPDLLDRLPAYLRPQDVTDDRLERFEAAGGIENADQLLRESFTLVDILPDFIPPRRTIYPLALPLEWPSGAPPAADGDPNDGTGARSSAGLQTGGGETETDDTDNIDYKALIEPWISGERLLDGPAGEKKVAHIVVVRRGADKLPSLEYWYESSGRFPVASLIEGTIDRLTLRRAFGKIGVSQADFDQAFGFSVPVEEFILDASGEKAAISLEDFLHDKLPFAFAYILFFTVFTGGQYLLMSVIEEKSNKIAEVLLSCVSPYQLMIGKLIGNFLASMTFMTLFLLFGIGASVAMAPLLSEQISVSRILFTGPALGWLIFYFMVGYAFIAAIYLAIGAVCSSIEDAQSFLGPFMIIFLGPLILLIPVVQNPNGLIASIMSFIPLYSPYILMIRVNSDPPLWEMIAASGVLVLSTVFMVFAMGRVFKKFILSHGFSLQLGRVFRASSR